MGDVGQVSQLLRTVFSWFTVEGGYAEVKKRRALHAKKEEALRALYDHNWDQCRTLVDELRALSTKS